MTTSWWNAAVVEALPIHPRGHLERQILIMGAELACCEVHARAAPQCADKLPTEGGKLRGDALRGARAAPARIFRQVHAGTAHPLAAAGL
jgi:hypothetical protein